MSEIPPAPAYSPKPADYDESHVAKVEDQFEQLAKLAIKHHNAEPCQKQYDEIWGSFDATPENLSMLAAWAARHDGFMDSTLITESNYICDILIQ